MTITDLTNEMSIEDIQRYAECRRKGVHMATHTLAKQLLSAMQENAKLRKALEEIVFASRMPQTGIEYLYGVAQQALSSE